MSPGNLASMDKFTIEQVGNSRCCFRVINSQSEIYELPRGGGILVFSKPCKGIALTMNIIDIGDKFDTIGHESYNYE